jgi:hypothetical protein
MSSTNSQRLASLAKNLSTGFPRSPRDLLAGYIIGARTLDKCRAFLNNSIGEYHFNCPLDNMFFEFTGISAEEFEKFVATGATDEEVDSWVAKHAKPRERIEIIKWNNDLRYKRISEMPDGIQEYMEDYIPQFIPANQRHHIDYFFDVYDAEEKRMET